MTTKQDVLKERIIMLKGRADFLTSTINNKQEELKDVIASIIITRHELLTINQTAEKGEVK